MPLKIRGQNFIRFVLWGVVIAFLYVSFERVENWRIYFMGGVRQSKMDLQYMMWCIIEAKYFRQKYLNRYNTMNKKKTTDNKKRKDKIRTMTNDITLIHTYSHNNYNNNKRRKKNRFYPKNFSISIENNQILVFKIAFIQGTQRTSIRIS